nr:retrovirus-related Pol polyprotein from transposon TNT 1-94 [Tanacetum cinerariifolium]
MAAVEVPQTLEHRGGKLNAAHDEEEVSSDGNEMVEVKVLMALAEENDAIKKEGAKKAEGFILPNHDTGMILLAEPQRNTTDPSVATTDSSLTKYDLADESSVCSTSLPSLKKLDSAEPIYRPKTIKSILRSKFAFKYKTLKSVIINEPFSAPTKGNKSSSASKVNSAPVADHNDIEWFRRGEELQAKKAKALKSSKAESSNANRSKTPTKSGCSRHMTGVKSYLYNKVEQPGPKVVFRDDSTYTTEGYDSIKCNGIVFKKVAFV